MTLFEAFFIHNYISNPLTLLSFLLIVESEHGSDHISLCLKFRRRSAVRARLLLQKHDDEVYLPGPAELLEFQRQQRQRHGAQGR